MPSVATLFLAAGACLVFYALLQAFSPLVAIYKHHRAAQAVGLPVKILPVPPGVFPFFAFQIIKRLGLATPGGAVEKMFNVGRADGFGMHGELGDTFLTVSTIGIGLVTADPKVASYVSARKEQFPKPPNTGALINLYGKNVINTRGEQWRIHRKVAGPVFSEKIHRDVWNEATRQAGYLLRAWNARSNSDEFVLTQLEDDALRLGMHVITGAAYGVPLGWDQNPPSATKTSMSYRRSLEQLTAYLMPLFLTPRWALRLAPRWTTWGQAWEAYSAFGGYMLGMLELARQKREKNEEPEEGDNLMTVLTRAELSQELDPTEVLGNAFIFLFAGHETTANTLHYALLLLTLHPEIQALVHSEIDELYGSRTSLVYDDFPRMRWVMAVMNETLRVFAPTAMVNKWTDEPTAIPYGRTTVVLPPNTRVSTNITGIHSNPAVWGPDAKVWRPARWIVSTPTTHFILPSAPPSPSLHVDFGAASLLTPTPAASRPSTPGLGAPDLLKPAKGTFLPFSEGSRMCSGRKFAAVEFCAVLCTLLKEHRLEMPRDWSEERMWGVVRGRKPGALTLQPPEPVPIVMVPRRR
ncbi:cytochrome P450 [Mycena vitilis]|nr:cytochrome P450 [Mycena vitilis]